MILPTSLSCWCYHYTCTLAIKNVTARCQLAKLLNFYNVNNLDGRYMVGLPFYMFHFELFLLDFLNISQHDINHFSRIHQEYGQCTNRCPYTHRKIQRDNKPTNKKKKPRQRIKVHLYVMFGYTILERKGFQTLKKFLHKFSSFRCAITLFTPIYCFFLADFQRVNTNHHANNDRKAKASHCEPVSVSTPGASPNTVIPQSGCISLLQIIENVLKMAHQNGTRFGQLQNK